ncbi:hypothetical protein DBV14_06410 [Variovorax sp. KBW07]|uniref:fimbrial protein n=1 Tax=Variovorax sp. KBW07 TaxID=2153358 RepID=UPI000F57E9F3|nr:fimbrial protein [Variovorax sp. KBW07]RQO60196.1 hypothetical protein DBV14_06410 [Variovorax sp. KBW07]
MIIYMTTKKYIRSLMLLGSFLLLSLASVSASASTTKCTIPPRSTLQTPAGIRFDPSLPIGTELWRGTLQSGTDTDAMCSGGNGMVTFKGTGVKRADQSYDTGIPGIGYRVHFLTAGCQAPAFWPVECGGIFAARVGAATIEVVLFKTGEIPPEGGSLSGDFLEWTYEGYRLISYAWTGSLAITPKAPTCAPAQPLYNIDLGRIPRSTFTGIGSVSRSQPLTIELQCTGDSRTSVTVRGTLTDSTNPANRSTSLTLASNSIASGIAIQILKGGVALGYGADSRTNGNPNQWLAGTTQAGIFRIPLEARAVQTGATVGAGSFNGRATYTMSYE